MADTLHEDIAQAIALGADGVTNIDKRSPGYQREIRQAADVVLRVLAAHPSVYLAKEA